MSEGNERILALQGQVSSADQFLVVVAGPNGAGKSTFVEAFLKPTRIRIVNPDHIARALSPEAPDAVAYEAAQAAETVRRDLLSRRISFCSADEPYRFVAEFAAGKTVRQGSCCPSWAADLLESDLP